MNTEQGKGLQLLLITSYAYYILGRSLISDEKFDKICVFLLKEWNNFEHQHKHLVTVEDLQAGTLYTLRDKDYPMMVKQAAYMRIDEVENGVKDAISN